jgi:hypothetical protein
MKYLAIFWFTAAIAAFIAGVWISNLRGEFIVTAIICTVVGAVFAAIATNVTDIKKVQK